LKPKPSVDPSPSPSAGSESTDLGPKPAPGNDEIPTSGPPKLNSYTGCALKRADRPCPGASDNIGDDVPGQAQDTVSDTRSGRPADDDAVEYDYLEEVQRERGTSLVNDKLENLQNRIDNHVPDDLVRNDEIKAKFTFDSKDPLPDPIKPDDPVKHQFDSVFDDKLLDHKPFETMLEQTSLKLTDSKGEREALRSNGADEQVLKWSWSGDQKLACTDWSYKKFDTSDMSPKPHYTELTMAMFKEKGIDPKT